MVSSSSGLWCMQLGVKVCALLYNKHQTHSDILTPLPALGVPFEIDDNKGPLLENTIRTSEQVCGWERLGDQHTAHLYPPLTAQAIAHVGSQSTAICRRFSEDSAARGSSAGVCVCAQGDLQSVTYKVVQTCVHHEYRGPCWVLLVAHGHWLHMWLRVPQAHCTKPSRA